MADKMREIFGDDSDSDDQEVEAQEENEKEEEEEEQEDGSEVGSEQNGDSNDESQQQIISDEENNNDKATPQQDDEDENNENEEANNDSNLSHNVDNNTQNKTDSDNGSDKGDNQAVEAVFGDELADLSGDSDEDDEGVSRSQNKTQITDDGEAEPEQEKLIEVEIPQLKTNFGKELHFVKLPNFLSVEPRPFDPEFYEDETADTDALDEEGKTRVKLKVENTIRWRRVKDESGNDTIETNSRIVRWSDGSLSMHLGNEIFDVYKQYMQGDHNHLCIRQGIGLQGQAVFRTKLAFRPHSTDSLTHRKMTMSLVDSGAKTQKVKILTELVKNPDAQRNEMIKKEEEKLKAASRRENQQRRMREKSHTKGISSAYLEDKLSEEDENAISLSEIKSRYKSGGRSDSKHSINSSDDESDRERRLNKAKFYDDDSDEEHGSHVNKKKKKVVADDDE